MLCYPGLVVGLGRGRLLGGISLHSLPLLLRQLSFLSLSLYSSLFFRLVLSFRTRRWEVSVTKYEGWGFCGKSWGKGKKNGIRMEIIGNFFLKKKKKGVGKGDGRTEGEKITRTVKAAINSPLPQILWVGCFPEPPRPTCPDVGTYQTSVGWDDDRRAAEMP